MTGCRCECVYLSVLIGILAGVVLGVLYALGFVATGIIFWLYLLVGLAGVFLSPIYAAQGARREGENCFCRYRVAFIVASVGAILTAAAGLIVAPLAAVTAIAILLALATFFSVTLVVLALCLVACICNR